jgi:hypothetical protein
MVLLRQQIQQATGLPTVPVGEYTGPGENLVNQWHEEWIEHERLSQSYLEAMRLYNECLARNGMPAVPVLDPLP